MNTNNIKTAIANCWRNDNFKKSVACLTSEITLGTLSTIARKKGKTTLSNTLLAGSLGSFGALLYYNGKANEDFQREADETIKAAYAGFFNHLQDDPRDTDDVERGTSDEE